MAKKPKKICIVILNYHQPDMTLDTLRSLKNASVPEGYSLSTVIIDNTPVPDENLAKNINKFKNTKLITTLKNTGFAKGNNLGIQYGLEKKCDYFLLLNNDTELHPSFLKHLIDTAETGADMVVPKIYFAKGYETNKEQYKRTQLGKVIWYAGGGFDWDNVYSKHYGLDQVDKGQFNKKKEIDFANFCCLLAKKDVFESVGLLNEKYFIYWEDGDFSIRAKQFGFNIVYQPKSIVWHKHSSSTGGSGSPLHDYYLTRNRLIFGYKYASLYTKLALFKESIKKIFTGRSDEKKGIIDYYLQRHGKGSFV